MNPTDDPQRDGDTHGDVQDIHDIIVVGAGPIGIACGVEARRAGLSAVIFEKGCLTDALFQFHPQLVFFSTPELLELGDVPMVISGAKPTRSDLLKYYRRIVEFFELDVRTYERVDDVERAAPEEPFRVTTEKGVYRSRRVVLATGFFDHPNLLDVPGEELSKVSHYYREPHPFYHRKVLVIGGQNSACEAALELYRNGAEVTLVHRRAELGRSVKYWVRPDIENRIREGSIRALMESHVVAIRDDSVDVARPDGSVETIDNDFVFAMTGYHADFDFLQKVGVELEGPDRRPRHDPETMETNVPGVHVAGVCTGGRNTTRIFIENGREHARRLVDHIAASRAR